MESGELRTISKLASSVWKSKKMKNLVIVESPTKARTLSQFLGKDYSITASMGHVRDLPRGELGVDVENNFTPKYVVPKEKIKTVNKLVSEATEAKKLWLATDPDREGEAIAAHLLRLISQKAGSSDDTSNYSRVVFHEITRDAVSEAFEKPRKIDEDLVEAQQARRILDRLVGYKLSPLLWKKVKSGLSAGRVQSVALRLIVDREREIEAFVASEYWVIAALLHRSVAPSELSTISEGQAEDEFQATLIKIGGEKAEVKNGQQAEKIVADLESASYQVAEIKSKDAKKYPNPPFTTSTLQQVAATRFGYGAKRTMRIAQDLYEQGYITYMRTDSVNLSEAAIKTTREFIRKKYGEKYLPAVPRRYKVKSKLAQEAHEAIRPTNVQLRADELPLTSSDHKKLYDLIHKRMVVCQMAEAVVAETTVEIEALRQAPHQLVRGQAQGKLGITETVKSVTYTLRTNGQKIKFDGWYRVYEKSPIKEQILPQLANGEELDLVKVTSEQKFTEPPSRYTEATLIRDLEKNGIGRPSTYAPIISTLYERLYIEKVEDRKIAPTPLGKAAVDFLVANFADIVDVSFTAQMEDNLDEIAQGKGKMVGTMKKFWGPFVSQTEKVLQEAAKVKVEVEKTDEKCERCGKEMVIRYGRFGKFLACSGFPDCKNTKALVESTGLTCPECGGNIVIKKTRRGKSFWGCSNYPKCKFASWKKPLFASSPALAADDQKALEGEPAEIVP